MSRLIILLVVCCSTFAAQGLWPATAHAWVDEAGAARLASRLSDGVLRWGGDAEGGAPFQLRDPLAPDRVIGFEVELADALAARLSQLLGRQITAEFIQYEWVSLPLGLEKADFDIILSGREIRDPPEANLRYSRPYYIYAEQLVVRRDEQRIRQLADCQASVVGTLAASAAAEVLARQNIQTTAFDGQVEPFLDLELGRLDAVLLDAPIVTYYGTTNPKLKIAGPPIEFGAYGIAALPQDADLLAALNEALSALMVSGELRDIYRRWHLWNPDQARLAQGAHRAEELAGLGFLPDGKPAENLPEVANVVDVHIIASSAKLWTFGQYAPLLLKAAGTTVLITVVSMALAMLLGLIVALNRLYGATPLRWMALGYVEFFRGIPLLLLLFFLYFGLSHYGLSMPAIVTAIVGFGLNYAAYEAEIYRSAILSVPGRQWEAARALGMSDSLAFRRIIFPQAFRTALGPMTNDAVALFKDTSLVSVIAVRELTKEYLILSRSSLKFVELGLLTAGLYLAMSVPLGYLSRYLERRWGKGLAP